MILAWIRTIAFLLFGLAKLLTLLQSMHAQTKRAWA